MIQLHLLPGYEIVILDLCLDRDGHEGKNAIRITLSFKTSFYYLTNVALPDVVSRL
jgi:hypothetical protein